MDFGGPIGAISIPRVRRRCSLWGLWRGMEINITLKSPTASHPPPLARCSRDLAADWSETARGTNSWPSTFYVLGAPPAERLIH